MATDPELTLVYAGEDAPRTYEQSIFLVGPSPRGPEIASYRPQIVTALEAAGYTGVVFIPEPRGGVKTKLTAEGYLNQVGWENRHLNLADVILCWVPRSDELPGYTTNVEWGVWQDSGKIVLGAPADASRMRYLLHEAKELGVPVATTIKDTVAAALTLLGEGALRTAGEREIPLFIWRTESFQNWYRSLQAAGNRLDHAKVISMFRAQPHREFVFMWILHVEIYLPAEHRSKTNEFVLWRPDISTIVLYHKAPHLGDTEVVLVREFRSTVVNPTGYVWENAGGSSFTGVTNPLALAAEECHEETGLEIAPERFVNHGARQIYATLLAHRAHLFSAELTAQELAGVKERHGQAYGVAGDTERTYVEVVTLGEIRRQVPADWSTLGMILQVLA